MTTTKHGPAPQLGLAITVIRRKLESFGLTVHEIKLIDGRKGGWHQATTSDGLRWGRMLAGHVEILKTEPAL